MAIRLRYLGHNLEVPEGQFVIGRSSRCQLSIDDALISRRHAVLIVQGETAIVDDLGSRNGVLVNGKRVEGTRGLMDGDTITIGSQNITIHGLRAATPSEGARPARRSDIAETMSGFDLADHETSDTVIRSAFVPINPDPGRRVHELSLVGAVAEKALALGRPEDALRLLDRPLKEILSRAQASPDAAARIDSEAVRQAAGLAIRIATAMGRGEWIDYVFELYAARSELLPQPMVDELYTLLRKIRVDIVKLRFYLGVLRAHSASLGPNERFLTSRIEGLEQLASLK